MRKEIKLQREYYYISLYYIDKMKSKWIGQLLGKYELSKFGRKSRNKC